MSVTLTRARRNASVSSLPRLISTVGVPSSQVASRADCSLANDRITSTVTSVTISTAAFTIEKSSPRSACCVVSAMISSRTKSNGVVCASVRRPDSRVMASRIRYIAMPRITESMMAHL
nr:hypothetical protein [Paracoccus thiocyanatus]